MRRKYDKNNLKSTLDKIDSLSHKAKMEFREVKKENERILKMFETRKSSYKENISINALDLENRTIKKITKVKTYGFSMSEYLLIECTDWQRVIIRGGLKTRMPDLELDKMVESGFYTDEEIQHKKDEIERDKKREEKERIERKKREMRRLQQEIGENK